MPRYRRMPPRTALVAYGLDRLPGIASMDLDAIQRARAYVYPAHRPVTWATGRVLESVRITEARIPVRDGYAVPARVYAPLAGAPGAPVVIYFHGGGWVLGSPRGYDPLCTFLADALGVLVVSPDYRMAPEHRAPQAALDSIDVATWVAEHGREQWGVDASRIAVTGDSAGGTLSAVVSQAMRDRGSSPIRGQALIYPATDMTLASPSHTEHADAPILNRESILAFRDHYCPDPAAYTDPLLSPLFGDCTDLPPALIQTADLDPLRDDGSRYAARLQEAGVPVRLTNYLGLPHGFASMPLFSVGGRRHRVELVEALRGWLA